MEEKFKFFLQKLRTLPECRNDDFYRIADYIELKCLTNADGSYSYKEFLDDARQRADDLGEGDFEDNQETKKLPKAQKNDKWESIATDSFRVIDSRIRLFGDLYPFTLSENKKSLSLKENLDGEQLYLFLLLCSDLKYTLKFKKELTSSFESVSLDVMENLFPNGELRLFGSSNTEGEDTEWKSDKLWDKLEWMGNFLNEEVRVSKEQISVYDKGDRGIDIVGKIPLGDNLSNIPILVAQCACSPKDWIVKQDSMKYDSWDRLISMGTYPNYMMFIPQSFRDSKGEWHDPTKIKKTNLIDRYRIVKNIKSQKSFKNTTAYPILEQILTIKESAF